MSRDVWKTPPKQEPTTRQRLIRLEGAPGGRRARGGCSGGARPSAGVKEKWAVGSCVPSVNHARAHLSEIPLRRLLPKLREIYLVGGKEPRSRVGTDGTKLSLTETDNSKTEI